MLVELFLLTMLILLVIVIIKAVCCNTIKKDASTTSTPNQPIHHMDTQHKIKHTKKPLREATDILTIDQPIIDESLLTESGEPANFFGSTLAIVTPVTETPHPWFPAMSLATLATWDLGTDLSYTAIKPSQSYTFGSTRPPKVFSPPHWSDGLGKSTTKRTLIDKATFDFYTFFTRPTQRTTTSTTTKRTTSYTTKETEPIIYNPLAPGRGEEYDVIDPDPAFSERTTLARTTRLKYFRKIFYLPAASDPHKRPLRIQHTPGIRKVEYTPKIIRDLTYDEPRFTARLTKLPINLNKIIGSIYRYEGKVLNTQGGNTTSSMAGVKTVNTQNNTQKSSLRYKKHCKSKGVIKARCEMPEGESYDVEQIIKSNLYLT